MAAVVERLFSTSSQDNALLSHVQFNLYMCPFYCRMSPSPAEKRPFKVSTLDGEEAYRRLLALRSAANAAPLPSLPPASPGHAGQMPALSTEPVTDTSTTRAAELSTVSPLKSPKTAGSHLQPGATLGVPAVAMMPVGASAGMSPSGGSGRRVTTARHLVGHVVVLGFPARCAWVCCLL